MTEAHINFFRRCWPASLAAVPMLRQADCILFATDDPPPDLYDTVFSQFHSFQIHKYVNPGYQQGAVVAMTTAMREQWFADYDWVIRVNADVIIRDDSFFRNVMVDPAVDGIFVRCAKLVQSDFFAFRPQATVLGAFDRRTYPRKVHAEPDTTLAFQEMLNSTRHRWLEGAHSNGRKCRVVGRHSPVIHDHAFVEQCPDLKSPHPKEVW